MNATFEGNVVWLGWCRVKHWDLMLSNSLFASNIADISVGLYSISPFVARAVFLNNSASYVDSTYGGAIFSAENFVANEAVFGKFSIIDFADISGGAITARHQE